jgi:hypothetical protein
MDWKQIYNHLDEKERLEMTKLMLDRLHGPRRFRIKARLTYLRPSHLLIPAALLQMLWFAIVMLRSPALPNLVIGNLVIIAIALLPSFTKRSFKNGMS